jgi:hypothetical protein
MHTVFYDSFRGVVLTTDTEKFIHKLIVQQMWRQGAETNATTKIGVKRWRERIYLLKTK